MNLVPNNDRNILIHKVNPTDTLQGICIKYKIRIFDLKKYNNLSGEIESTPGLAIKFLKIPKSKTSQNIFSGKDNWKRISLVRKLRCDLNNLISADHAINLLEIKSWDYNSALLLAKKQLNFSSIKPIELEMVPLLLEFEEEFEED